MIVYFEIVTVFTLLVGAMVICAFCVNVIAKNVFGTYLFKVTIKKVK